MVYDKHIYKMKRRFNDSRYSEMVPISKVVFCGLECESHLYKKIPCIWLRMDDEELMQSTINADHGVCHKTSCEIFDNLVDYRNKPANINESW